MSALNISSQLGTEDFFKLMIAQLQNQDPLDPLKSTDFLGQLAQLSTLNGIEKLNANFADQLTMQQLSGGSALIGQTVTFLQPITGIAAQGTVQSLSVDQGKVTLQIDGQGIPLSSVTGVK